MPKNQRNVLKCKICKKEVDSFAAIGGKCGCCNRRVREGVCVKCGKKGVKLLGYFCKSCQDPSDVIKVVFLKQIIEQNIEINIILFVENKSKCTLG